MRCNKQLTNKQLKYHPVTSTQQGNSRTCRETYLDAEVTYLDAEGLCCVGEVGPTQATFSYIYILP